MNDYALFLVGDGVGTCKMAVHIFRKWRKCVFLKPQQKPINFQDKVNGWYLFCG